MKRKVEFLAFILCICVLCAGCQSKKGETSAELTEEQLKSDHLTMDLSEDIHVDADITPLEKYEKGVSTYYMEQVKEKGTIKDIQKRTFLYGRPIEDIYDICRKNTRKL